MPDFYSRREAGFTLFEVVVVMALIAILSAVAVLSMAFYIPNLRLKSAAQDINLQIRKSRLEAIRRSERVAIRFYATDVSGTQKFGPIIWVDDNYDPGNPAHPLLETGERVLFRMPLDESGGVPEVQQYKGIRFDNSYAGDGVTFQDNAFVLNSRGISNRSGSIHLYNARGRTKEVMVTLGGATRIQ